MFDDLDKFSNSAKLDANKDKNRSSIALPCMTKPHAMSYII